MITVSGQEIATVECQSVIIVPEMALREAGYIKTLTTAEAANAKHEFFALGQMALFQYQDEELKAELCVSPLIIHHEREEEHLERGLIVCRDQKGQLRLLAHKEINLTKLLEATNRFCTRWVRLDI
ncbi:MAG TPA: hypothetical protein DEB25_03655 [Desulfobulbaceae bacterium]|nr:hypothetical protein [Desulfobulbaceae bacterium]